MSEFSILVSTMNRSNLKFLNQMFPLHDLKKLNLVIVNQTTVDNQISSTLPNIKTINSFEVGLSKSRNLAMQHCTTKFGLVADDDLIYNKDFEDIVQQAIVDYNNFGLIAFQLEDEKHQPFKEYSPHNHEIKSNKQIENISSAEILLNLELLKKNHLKFDLKFGINAIFPMGEEQVLATQIRNKKIKMQRVNVFIAKHHGKSSGHNPTSEGFIKTAIARKFPDLKNFIYLWIFKYLFFLWRKNHIQIKELPATFKKMNQCVIFVKKYQKHEN